MKKLTAAAMMVCCIFWLSAAVASSTIDSLYLIGKRWQLHQPYAAFNWREPGETIYHQMYVIGIVDRSKCPAPELLIYSPGCAEIVEVYTVEVPGTGQTWMSPDKADEENSR